MEGRTRKKQITKYKDTRTRSIGKEHPMPSFYIPFSIESAKWKPAKRKDHAGAGAEQSPTRHPTAQHGIRPRTTQQRAPEERRPAHRELQHPRPTLRCTPGASRLAEEAGEAQPVPVPVPFPVPFHTMSTGKSTHRHTYVCTIIAAPGPSASCYRAAHTAQRQAPEQVSRRPSQAQEARKK